MAEKEQSRTHQKNLIAVWVGIAVILAIIFGTADANVSNGSAWIWTAVVSVTILWVFIGILLYSVLKFFKFPKSRALRIVIAVVITILIAYLFIRYMSSQFVIFGISKRLVI
jgi:phosphatidylserine synthase